MWVKVRQSKASGKWRVCRDCWGRVSSVAVSSDAFCWASSCEQCRLIYSEVLSQEMTGTCGFCVTLLATASSTELLPHYLLPKYCSLKPGESDEEWGRDCSKDYWAGILDRIVVLHLIFFFFLAGGGGSFFIDSDNGQSKWFSHSNLPKNHRRDFLPYLKYDFCYY